MSERGWIRHDITSDTAQFEPFSTAEQAAGPVLLRAELFTLTGNDNKDKDTGIDIEVLTADGRTLLAFIGNADSSGTDATEYNDNSAHTVPLIIFSPGAPRDACIGFTVHMSISTNGNDTWKIRQARVALLFSDGNTLIAEKDNFQLKNNGASTDFSS